MSSLTAETHTERMVDVAGLSVCVREAGTGQPVVVLHHSTGPMWSAFYDELAGSFAVVAPDLPGYGRSDRPEWARHPRDEAILTSQLIDELGLDRVHLVGLGLGGWIAAELATMNGRQLASLTIVGAAGLKPREGEIFDFMNTAFDEYVRYGFKDEAAYERLFGAEPDQLNMQLWDFSREMTARLNWKPWMYSWELRGVLPGVRTPTLVVWGSDDRVIPLDCGKQYAELIPQARLEVVEESGHSVDLEQPEALARLVGTIAVPS